MDYGRRIRGCIVWLSATVLLALASSRSADAGCGCNKPPPLPATVIPAIAYPGMEITLYDPSLIARQQWSVTFDNGTQTATVTGRVHFKRDITDSTGKTRDNQLVVTVPNIGSGPTSISASNGGSTIDLPNSSFVVMGKPVIAHQQNSDLEDITYSTGVGADGTLYLAVSGLNKVCDAIDFTSLFSNYPLRFGDGDVQIFNWQGYYIDALTPASHNHFSIQPGNATSSDILFYGRHSFQTYCKQHLPGGTKQVDPHDKNWHRDGTPHVDYAAVIFAIKGHFDGGATLPPGPVQPPPLMNLTTELGQGEDWNPEPSDPED